MYNLNRIAKAVKWGEIYGSAGTVDGDIAEIVFVRIQAALESNTLPTKQLIREKSGQRPHNRDVGISLDNILSGVQNGDGDSDDEDESDDDDEPSIVPECDNDRAFERVRDALGVPHTYPF